MKRGTYLEKRQLNRRKIQRILPEQGWNGEKWRRGKFKKPKPKKLKNSGKPKGHAINSTDQHAPRGHAAYGVATMHLIWSETPSVMDSSGKPFIFYGHHDTSWHHRTWGATNGIDETTSPRRSHWEWQSHLDRRRNQSPLTRIWKSFNIVNKWLWQLQSQPCRPLRAY